MTKVGEVYLCEICGNKVKVQEAGVGALVCCGQSMTLVGSQGSKRPPKQLSTEPNW